MSLILHPKSSVTLSPASALPRRGSALILTLMVVSLMVLMVLAFSAFVRMELKGVASQQHLHGARANARLAAEIALGQLQHLLGPDQRVSATADLFRGGGNNLYQAALQPQINRRNWVGVWDATGYNERDAAAKPFLGWLISDAGATFTPLNGVSLPPDTSHIPLVSSGSVSSVDDRISVPAVSIAGSPGRYAFWVGDEGVKARFNLQDPYRNSTDTTTRQYSMKATQRHAAELFTYDNVRRLADDNLYPLDNPAFTATREKMAGKEQLALLAGGTGPAANAYRQLRLNRFHDITLHSRGVLADVRKGGLKQDLSLAFEMPLTEFNASRFGDLGLGAEIPVYRPPGFPSNQRISYLFHITDFSPFGFQPSKSPDATPRNPPKTIDPVLRGPNWHFVRNYARLYKQNDPDRSHFGLSALSYTESGGNRRYFGRSLFPKNEGLTNLRRYGQDANVWTYAEYYGPLNTNYSQSQPVGRPIFPGISPLVTRVQTVLSLRSRPADPALPAGDRVLDLYIDPIVTLWNPYNVPLATGSSNGQPIQLSVRYLNMRLDLQRQDTATEYRKDMKVVFQEASAGNVYDESASETFQLTFPGNIVMEPGEVMIFSYDGPTKTYQRLPGVKDNEYSGVNLDMSPGITGDLRGNSGIKFVDPWKLSLPASVGIRFKTNLTSGSKFQVAGVNRTAVVSEPFFSSFEAGTSSFTTGWSDGGSYLPLNNPALASEKRPYWTYDAYLKPENSPNPVNIITHYNLRASTYEQGNFFGADSSAQKKSLGQEDLWQGNAFSQTTWNGTWISNMGENAYWGGSNSAAGGSMYVSLFEVPRLPPLSLATLQHAQVTFMADEPSYAIGNSHAPVFGRDDQKVANQTLKVINSAESRDPYPSQPSMVRPDWSFLINEALWDSFYFSSITPKSTGTAADTFAAFQSGGDLPNSTFSYHRGKSESDASIFAKLFSGGEALRDSPTLVSENLLVEGAFNINSTSVEAWRAILSSSRNLAINVQDSSAPRTVPGTVYSRTAIPFDRDDDKWHGFRSITDAQIDSIAREIVNQVRTRGPFLNLADFINRRLVPANHATQKKGPLQAAIDASGVNSSFTVTLASRGFNNNNLNAWLSGRMDPQSPVAMGAPGYLTQADILTLIGPLLSPRSDTFIIRAYGEYGSGDAKSRAWCELTVQRIPEIVDSSRPPVANSSWRPSDRPPAGGYDTAPFKRRFVITGFRWLAADDV